MESIAYNELAFFEMVYRYGRHVSFDEPVCLKPVFVLFRCLSLFSCNFKQLSNLIRGFNSAQNTSMAVSVYGEFEDDAR